MNKAVLRWLVPVGPIVLSFFPAIVHADPVQGLKAVGYYVDAIPPTRSDSIYPSCGSEIENNINRNYEGEPFQNCGDDLFMIHYTGAITIPAHDSIEFWIAADDGGTINIAGIEVGTWNDKGCSATESGPLDLAAGTYSLDGWFYENGGGTCFMLAWNIDGAGWTIVPDEAFTTQVVVPTTSTSTSTTTTSTSTTTTSTTVEPQVVTTTTPETTTTEPEATTTTTAAPATTTTEAATTTSSSSTSTTSIAPRTTTSSSSTILEATTTTTPSPSTTQTPPETTTIPDPTTTTTLSPVALEERVDPAVLDLVENLSDLSKAEIVAAIATILETGLNEQEATLLATNPDVLAVVTQEEAVAIFDAIELSELSDAEALALVAAVQEASAEVREAFEDEIDIFAGSSDTYVPLGSSVPISTRRVIIASAALVITGTPAPTRRKAAA